MKHPRLLPLLCGCRCCYCWAAAAAAAELLGAYCTSRYRVSNFRDISSCFVLVRAWRVGVEGEGGGRKEAVEWRGWEGGGNGAG